MESGSSLKDYLFNEKKVKYLAGLLAEADANFPTKRFMEEVLVEFPQLELKQRISHITNVLHKYLPADYEEAVVVILKSLPPPLDPHKTDDDFGDFIFAPFGEYVARYGCKKGYLKISFNALEELTMRFSMEDAIRYFLRAFPKETLAECKKWTGHNNYHVRRLVSEGTRPLLPWSGRISLTPKDTLPLLTKLHQDNTRYVVRSVANHLNDLSKTDPDLVVETLRAWQKLSLQNEKEFNWLAKHALRTLVKNGHKEALAFLGFKNSEIVVERFFLEKEKIARGDTLSLSLILSAQSDCRLLIDYIIHFVKKNGSTQLKVFKWKQISLNIGERVELKKNHVLKADATTFTLYAGLHSVEIQINGQIAATTQFMMVD